MEQAMLRFGAGPAAGGSGDSSLPSRPLVTSLSPSRPPRCRPQSRLCVSFLPQKLLALLGPDHTTFPTGQETPQAALMEGKVKMSNQALKILMPSPRLDIHFSKVGTAVKVTHWHPDVC